MRNQRILFINQTSELGGGELALLDFVSNLQDAHVVVLSPGPLIDALNKAGVSTSVYEAGGIMAVRRSDGFLAAIRGGMTSVKLIYKLAKLARRYDAVYANSQKAFIVGAFAAKLARKPLIWHLHDILSAEHFSAPLRRICIMLANTFATRIIANSYATEKSFRNQGGRSPISVVHNGIDPLPFGKGHDPGERKTLSQQIGSGGAPIVGVFGRLATWKGQDIAIHAMNELPDHHLILVGGALFGGDDYRDSLIDLVNKLGISQRVHFLGFQRDVSRLMRAVDVVVHCSTSAEPFGRVIVEGMMAGVPVIATAAGGALEIINDGKTGLLVPPKDPLALAHALASLSQNPEMANCLARQGRAHALKSFNLGLSIERLRAAVALAINEEQSVVEMAP